jgi:uncharacterized membrane protein YedE/YeeE
MINSHPVLFAGLAVLSFFIGYVGNRTPMCSVMAVDEFINQKRYDIFASFLKIIIWVFGITVIFELAGIISPARSENYAFRPQAMLGGIIFGIGAVINGGCSMNTLIQFCRGRLGLIFSFIGFAFGVVAAVYIFSFSQALQPIKIKPFAGFSTQLLSVLPSYLLSGEATSFITYLRGHPLERGEIILKESAMTNAYQPQYLALAMVFWWFLLASGFIRT